MEGCRVISMAKKNPFTTSKAVKNTWGGGCFTVTVYNQETHLLIYVQRVYNKVQTAGYNHEQEGQTRLCQEASKWVGTVQGKRWSQDYCDCEQRDELWNVHGCKPNAAKLIRQHFTVQMTTQSRMNPRVCQSKKILIFFNGKLRDDDVLSRYFGACENGGLCLKMVVTPEQLT